jgi:hypothetical protein
MNVIAFVSLHTLEVFENRELRKIFGAKADEVTGDWRKLRYDEFNNFYCLPGIINQVG